MQRNELPQEAYGFLRSEAEERVKKWSHYEIDEHTDLHQVIKELQIHLAEQEILNERLVLAMKGAIEEEKSKR